jgi:large subunit ribosomal protein L31e
MSKNESLTRIYVVPLRKAFEAPKYRRTKVALRLIREFATRHMKSDEIKLDESLNSLLWSRGIGSPPRRVKLEMEKNEEGVVSVRLASDSER